MREEATVFTHTLIDQAEMHRADLVADAAHQRVLRTLPRRSRSRRRLAIRFTRPVPASSTTVCCA